MAKQETFNGQTFKTLVEYIKRINDIEDSISRKIQPANKVAVTSSRTSILGSTTSEDIKDTSGLSKTEKQLDKVIEELQGIEITLKGVFLEGLKGIKSMYTGSPGTSNVVAKSKAAGGVDSGPTFKETLKGTVSSFKGGLNKFMEAGGNFVEASMNPGAVIKKAYGSIKNTGTGILGSAKDILSTEAGYDYKKDRAKNKFADVYSRTAEGSRYQKGGKSSVEVGKDVFEAISKKLEEIKAVELRIAEFTSQGFKPNKKDTKELEKLQTQLADIDPRHKEDKRAVTESKISSPRQKSASKDVEAKAIEPKTSDTEKKSKAARVLEKKESAADRNNRAEIVNELKANNKTIGSLLAVAQKQLDSVNVIKSALAPETPKEITEQKSSPSAAAPVEEKSNIVGDAISAVSDLAGNGGSKAKAGKGIGGKILGGLGKAARVAGKLAAPVAVGMAAYDAASGYQNAKENLGIEGNREATLGEKLSSGAGSLASGLTFGLLDEKKASKGIAGFFGAGPGKTDIEANSNVTAGSEVAKATEVNTDMNRESSKGGGGGNTIVSNNVNNNNTTKFVPMKGNPRPEFTGSALDRYQSRITIY